MADTAETAYSPSDDELDDIIGEIETEEGVTADDDLEPTPSGDDDDLEEEVEDPAASGDEEVGSREAGDGEDEIDEDRPQAPATTVAPPTAIPKGAKPFQFKASGGVHTLEGALELPDGAVLIPKTAQAAFRQQLASGRELQTSFKQLQREQRQERERAKAERTDKDVVSDALSAMFADVMKMSPDERWAWCEKLDEERPKLELEIERKKLAEREKALELRANPPKDPETVAEEREAAIVNELNMTFQNVMKQPEIKVLTREEVRAVYDKHRKRLDRLVAKGDDGKEMFDDADVIEDLNLLIRAKKKAGGPSAEERNSRRNADTSNAIPPTPARRVPTGQPRKGGKKSYSGDKKGFKDDFMSGVLDSK